MKPIRLVMSAFGPYKDKVEIDFEKLGENGVFLITGDTGSGKTTIFDAISFALFGSASGSRRENNTFRSDFVSDNVKTYVVLEFIHKDVFYTVERVPRYMRKKLRGEGKTTVGGDASLTYGDKVFTGDKIVTDKCVEILGISASQFKQISMIAQGEFMELLLAKPQDRATIFRHIFDTGMYKDISDRLKNKYLEKKREYEDIKFSLVGYENGIVWGENTDIEVEGSNLLSLLEQKIAVDKEAEGKLLLEHDGILKGIENLIQQISEGNFINDSFDRLACDNELLEELKKREFEILEKRELVVKNKEIWSKIIPKYQELEQLKETILEKENLLKQNEKLYQEINSCFEEVFSKFKGLNILLEKLEQVKDKKKEWEDKLFSLIKIDDLQRQIEKQKLFRDKILLSEKKVILNQFERLRQREVEIEELRQKLLELKDVYFSKNQEYLKNYDLFLSSQAGILASTLKDNCPCPVCGSLVHPNIACYEGSLLSKEVLDLEKKEVEEVSIRVEDIRLRLQDMEADLKQLTQDLQGISEDALNEEIAMLEEHLKSEDVSLEQEGEKSIYTLEIEIGRLEVQFDELRQIVPENVSKEMILLEIDKLDKTIDKSELEIKGIREDYEYQVVEKANVQSLIQVLESDLGNLKDKMSVVQGEYVSVYRELGYKQEEDYVAVQLSKEELEAYDSEILNYDEEVSQLKHKIEVQEKVVLGKKRVDILSLENEKCQKSEKLNLLDLSLKSINNTLSNNIKIYNEIKCVYKKVARLEHELAVYKDLSDTANGMIAGKNKLEFEQFVQASYFEQVIVEANKRLGSMTEDRYQLMRKKESFKLSDKLGLELEVMDYYTGKKRDIKSLSGGESFKAALSLALGMSDTIMSYSGGIVVDAMFIDEGFGSLDSTSLESAIDAIMMLSQGNRLIGIISHVNELKDRIDKKIVVCKGSSGSSVRVEV